MIAHGSKMGHSSVLGVRCHLANNVSIAGSVVLGDDCFLGSGSAVRPHAKLATGTIVGVVSRRGQGCHRPPHYLGRRACCRYCQEGEAARNSLKAERLARLSVEFGGISEPYLIVTHIVAELGTGPDFTVDPHRHSRHDHHIGPVSRAIFKDTNQLLFLSSNPECRWRRTRT